MGLFDTTTELASLAVERRTRQLERDVHVLQSELDPPDSWVEAGGETTASDRFQDRKAKRAQLEEYHDVRVDGGIVAALLEARGLMVFGTGAEYTAERDAVAAWLNDQFDALDLLTLDIGTDSLFYGYALGEVRETPDDDFGKLELIEPWTTVPEIDRHGEITEWEQEISRFRDRSTNTFDPADIWHFHVMKESGRDPVGMSMLGRAMDEAVAYRDNQQAIQNAVTLHGFPKWHVKLGREGGAVIDDNELRRARPMFDNINETTKWLTGQDVDIDVKSPEGFDFEGITEHDLSKLAIAFMLPVELTQLGGGDGLGTGFPARLRERLFLLSAQAQQNTVSGQLVDFGKHLIREYAPPDIQALAGDLDAFDLGFEFDDPITDMDELQSKVNAIGDDMTVNERRSMFGLPELDDESVGEDFERPGATDPGGFGDEGDSPDIGLQGAGLSNDMLSWVRTYADDGGSLDDSVGDMVGWLEDFADAPSEAISRLREGVAIFANAQGIGVEEASEQPVGNLLSYFAEHRNLQAPEEYDYDTDPDALFQELQAYRDGFEAIVWADLADDIELQDADHPVVTFSNVGGDPFVDQESMDAFLEELDEAAEGQVYIGKFPWPDADSPPIHDRPIVAVGISESDANRIYDRHEANVSAISPASEVDDVTTVFMAGPTFGGDDDVPANVRNRLDEAARFVSWSDTEGVPPGNLQSFFVEKLSQPNGWSIDSLQRGLRDEFGARMGEPDERVNIARTKSAALLNQAKRMAFEDLEEGIEGDLLYYWDGPQDDDTTEACTEFKELTNPEHGGTPRPREEFDSLMAEIQSEHFPDFESGGDAIHFNERHAIDAMLPSQADVDPAGVGGMATAPGDD